MLGDISLGRYLQVDSFLHRCDPRLKLVGLPLLMIAALAAGGWLRLLLLSGLWLLLAGVARTPRRIWWKTARALRFLLLFTLLLHLLLTPGRTLVGTSWLSLDGLQVGLLTCWKLLLALFFASLLTLTTRPEEVAAALARLLAPLERIGLPAAAIGEFVQLVLYFVPILQEEVRKVADSHRPDAKVKRNLWQRCKAVGVLVEPLVLRLVDRADQLAHQVAAGQPVLEPLQLPAFRAGTGNLVLAATWLVIGGLLFLV